ncbi:uncharacterized protein LOC126837090 [Adelges cooleyi]|uniref:uncharacterized protein LOC126837090 n=1 Tax=Adelges cooleyi TaxID=133065 RepID=UPI00217FB423|nr:uncharacterized protein LOC126837090 [Adelges cooleyi]
MIWKIILLLSCFNVLVNAGGSCSGGASGADEDYQAHDTISEWIDTLNADPNIDWNRLIIHIDSDDKKDAKAALMSSGVPKDDLNELLVTCNWNTWPSQIKSNQHPYVNKSNMAKLSLYRIPDTRIVYAAPNVSQQVSSPGILMVFTSL